MGSNYENLVNLIDNAELSIRSLESRHYGISSQLNNLPGVVTNGLWALRPADVVLMATGSGVKEIS